jgi:hypothetical protein
MRVFDLIEMLASGASQAEILAGYDYRRKKTSPLRWPTQRKQQTTASSRQHEAPLRRHCEDPGLDPGDEAIQGQKVQSLSVCFWIASLRSQ